MRKAPDAPCPRSYEVARARFLAALKREQQYPRSVVLLNNTWHEFMAHARDIGKALLCGLVLMGVVAAGLRAVEVPDRILVGLCAVETGTEWRGIGDVRGKWSRGADGELSPFQLSAAALTDMGVRDHSRVHRDVIYAESLTRLWLSRCFTRHGNWPDAVAAYNAGSRYRSRTAREYAARVLNIAGTL